MNFSQQADCGSNPELSIIVPARNEEDCIGDCIRSLKAQQGVQFELLVVDDGSSDRTRQIATEHGAKVVDPEPLSEGWSGKSNALVSGVRKAKGKWLLFTDADTIHSPGSLQAALTEAKESDVALLSYSPRQIVQGFWQRALMPVIFAELATHFRPRDICDPQKPAAAANGQYILVHSDVYAAVGGHGAFAATLLEDVALARLVKSKGYRLRFRTSDSVSARMYRNTRSMWEGWTKNLVLLFSRPVFLSVQRSAEFMLMAGALIIAIFARHTAAILWSSLLVFTITYLLFLRRILKAHFRILDNVLSILGLPIFSLLLLRSYIHYKVRHSVEWKGRSYSVGNVTSGASGESIHGEPADNVR